MTFFIAIDSLSDDGEAVVDRGGVSGCVIVLFETVPARGSLTLHSVHSEGGYR